MSIICLVCVYFFRAMTDKCKNISLCTVVPLCALRHLMGIQFRFTLMSLFWFGVFFNLKASFLTYMYQAIFFKTLSHASDHPQHFHQSQQMRDPVFALVRLRAGVTEYPRDLYQGPPQTCERVRTKAR